MITPEFKDFILNYYIDNFEFGVNYHLPEELLSKNEIVDEMLIEVIADYLNSLGYLSKSIAGYSITIEAHDLKRRGGFTFLESKFIQDMEKAKLELEKLQSKSKFKDDIEHISRITGIITNLISTAHTFI